VQGGLPFLLRVCRGVISSLGLFSYGGKLKHQFTAHPKIDPKTGEMLFFHYECAALRLLVCS
jgi:carotenoid cleavage dioxygenase-like enzyme